MAVDFDITTKRGSVYYANPQDIIATEENRGRYVPPTEDKILSMAVSLHEQGQIQPVKCRNVSGVPHLVAGFTRFAAARVLLDGFEYEGKTYRDENFKLQFTTITCNDQKAFIQNLVENHLRNATSRIDDAHNQEKLRAVYGYSEKDIAAVYKTYLATVAQNAKFLLLDDQRQAMVHDGTLPVSAALTIFDLPLDQQAAVIEEATKDNGKVSGEAVKRQVREKHLADPQGKTVAKAGKPKPKKLSRSIKEVREFWEDQVRLETKKGLFVGAMIGFINGEITEGDLKEAWVKV